MRQDKLTTKFQEALGDAQSLALGHDNAYIEPMHLLLAMLRQQDGPRGSRPGQAHDGPRGDEGDRQDEQRRPGRQAKVVTHAD